MDLTQGLFYENTTRSLKKSFSKPFSLSSSGFSRGNRQLSTFFPTFPFLCSIWILHMVGDAEGQLRKLPLCCKEYDCGEVA